MNNVNERTVEEARKASILDYAEKIGISVFQTSNDEYRLKEHDSCVIKPSKNLFYWNSRQVVGGPIEFAKNFGIDSSLSEADKFKAAVKNITDHNVSVAKVVKEPKEPFYHDVSKISARFDQARGYLVNVRNLDREFVDKLHDIGLIDQNNQGNVQFNWIDPNTRDVVGVSEQGTKVDYKKYPKRGTLKKIQKNSEPNYGFSFTFGQPENLKFFESSIDAISYVSLNLNKPSQLKNTRFVSMEGLKPQTAFKYTEMTMAETKSLPKSVSFAVDRDEAGDNFLKKMQKFQLRNGQQFRSLQPSLGKDWNEVLVNKRKNINQQLVEKKKKIMN